MTKFKFSISSGELAERAIAFTLFLIWLACAVNLSFDFYTPDSWSYIDISHNLINKFGYVNGIRSFGNEPWLNDSFPFLWPAVIALGEVFSQGNQPVGAIIFTFLIWPASGYGLSVLAFGHISSAAHRVRKAMLGSIVLVLIPGYLAEGLSGRSIPLSIMVGIYALFFAKQHVRTSSSVYLYLVLVCLVLISANRFDGPILAVALIYLINALNLWTFKKNLALLTALLAGQIPWVAHSLLNLNAFFASSSAAGIGSPGLIRPDYFLTESLAQASRTFNFTLLNETFMKAALAATLSALPLVVLLVILKKSGLDWSFESLLHSRLVRFVLVGAIAELVLIAFSGFSDYRYFAPFTAAIAFIFLQALQQATFKKAPLLLLSVILGAVSIVAFELNFKPYKLEAELTMKDLSCVKQFHEPLMISGIKGYKIAALTQKKILIAPGNEEELSSIDWQNISQNYNVDTWLTFGEGSTLPSAASRVYNHEVCIQ